MISWAWLLSCAPSRWPSLPGDAAAGRPHRTPHFARRNGTLRTAWLKPLESLGALNQAFRGMVCFQRLKGVFVSPFSRGRLFQRPGSSFRFAGQPPANGGANPPAQPSPSGPRKTDILADGLSAWGALFSYNRNDLGQFRICQEFAALRPSRGGRIAQGLRQSPDPLGSAPARVAGEPGRPRSPKTGFGPNGPLVIDGARSTGRGRAGRRGL